MYTPKLFQNTDTDAIRKFIRENGFGILVSQGDGQLFATHIPLLLSDDGTKLTGHVARGNRQWKTFQQAGEVLAIFNGPHTYISASWYDHENVSTWNYVAVHVSGTLRVLTEEELKASLKQLVDKYEKDSEKAVSVEGMSPAYLKHELMGIVGFEIDIKKTEAIYKLSQNRDAVNHEAIVNELEKRGDTASKEVAELMREHGYKG